MTKNGNAEAVEGLVIALRGADARQVVDGVRTPPPRSSAACPLARVSMCSTDRSDLIERAVGTVEEALIEATVLVVVLLILFLGDWRAAAIVAATLPMAALITFLFMRGMGLPANLMSLGGLAIAIGMLVDGAVVVVENVVERLGRRSRWRYAPAQPCVSCDQRSDRPGLGRHPHHRAGVPAVALIARVGGQSIRPQSRSPSSSRARRLSCWR